MQKKLASVTWWLLLGLYALPRMLVLATHDVAFSFDHGKDSLAVLHMLLTQSPKLIGPWTSIPGLYFGPGWYYLLAPTFLLTNFHPLAGTLTMVLVGAFQLWLVYRYFGKLTALVVASTPFWLAVTSSAWNPFPITFTSWAVLICLNQLMRRVQSGKMWLLLGLAAGMGFHFSTAFAVLYPPFIALGLFLRQVRVTARSLAALAAGFAIPFVPQLLFELRHQFLQTKGVLAYLTGQVNIETSAAPSSWFEVLKGTIFQVQSATMPDLTGVPLEKNIELALLIGLMALGLWMAIRAFSRSASNAAAIRKLLQKHHLAVEFVGWVLLSSIWFYKLHFNTWYLYGLMPLMVLFFVSCLRLLPKTVLYSLVPLLILTPFASTARLWLFDRQVHAQSTVFLPLKEQAIAKIYELAGDRPFAVYHYEPDIYDFAYQYLYFSQARRGERLPTEFSYQPGVPTYIAEKPELLQAFQASTDTRAPEVVFFLVEAAHVDALQQAWWNHQHYSQITQTVELSESLTLYVAQP